MKIYKSCEEIKIFYFVYTYTYMYYCLNISITLMTCRRTKGGLDIILIKRLERLAERLYERLLKVNVSFPTARETVERKAAKMDTFILTDHGSLSFTRPESEFIVECCAHVRLLRVCL